MCAPFEDLSTAILQRNSDVVTVRYLWQRVYTGLHSKRYRMGSSTDLKLFLIQYRFATRSQNASCGFLCILEFSNLKFHISFKLLYIHQHHSLPRSNSSSVSTNHTRLSPKWRWSSHLSFTGLEMLSRMVEAQKKDMLELDLHLGVLSLICVEMPRASHCWTWRTDDLWDEQVILNVTLAHQWQSLL